ncbi:MAG: hypothetical protein FWH26_03150 [Oscillospiraceae bacterium]|nr:hypothetical protein [Oscillospiraceae bacterium]
MADKRIPSTFSPSLTRFVWEHRWGMAFLNLTAFAFAAPFLFWNCILMPIVMQAAHAMELLQGLGALFALGNVLALMLAMLGAGGCLSALRGLLDGSGGYIISGVFRAMRRRAGSSLLAGGLLGLSLGVMRAGLMNLRSVSGMGWRCALSVSLALQFLLVCTLCILAMARDDGCRAKPHRVFAGAAAELLTRPGRQLLYAVATVAPLAVFFLWQNAALTVIGLLLTAAAPLPVMLIWSRRAPCISGGQSAKALIGILLFAGLSAVPALAVSPWNSVRATLRESMAFLFRLTMQDADNGTIRDMLANSSVWPVVAAAILGTGCCVVVSYVCACYRFKGRKTMLALAVTLQLLPLLSSYASLEQLLRNLRLPITPVLLGVVWTLLYLLLSLLLYRRFASLRPELLRRQEKSGVSGPRLLFYHALPRVRLYIAALLVLVTLGCWNDALAPFWHLKQLGAFTVSSYLWETMRGTREPLLYLCVFAAALAVLTALPNLLRKRRKLP